MKASNVTRNVVLADRITEPKVCPTQRAGHPGTNGLCDGEGLWISPRSANHSSGRQYEFDAVFVDTRNQVVGVCQRLRNYGISQIFLVAQGVLELPAGMVEKTGTGLGDKIAFEKLAGGCR
jgi:hypothetical protein